MNRKTRLAWDLGVAALLFATGAGGAPTLAGTNDRGLDGGLHYHG